MNSSGKDDEERSQQHFEVNSNEKDDEECSHRHFEAISSRKVHDDNHLMYTADHSAVFQSFICKLLPYRHFQHSILNIA